MTFYAGVLLIGGVLILFFGFGVGYAARGDDARRYRLSREQYAASAVPQIAEPVHATAQRVLPQPAPQHITTNVILVPGMPQPDAIQRQPMVLEAAPPFDR